MSEKANRDFTSSCRVILEKSINANGWNFLTIYGKHVNGYFIAVINWNICTEAGEPGSVSYNTEKLINAGFTEENAQAIANHIKEALKD
jgi:hypothetical protein